MDIHDAKVAGHLAATLTKNEDNIRALRERPLDVIDVSGLTVFGKELAEDLKHGVVDAIRNHLDMRFVRRCQFNARALRDLGVEMGQYPTETDPSLGDQSEMSDRKFRETTGQDDPFQEARDAHDIVKAKGWLASETLLGTMRGENIMLKVNLRRVQRGLPALAF
ncbi:hypothetical protein Q8W71_00610 [Methylobacterium sp. NEAU 140]|uniref:hypothetical protein n=1 Tax=Methylobacterium sp. NEAU 140 TaxID=3064945 RepID=UPI002733C7C7|nr:hypothetical protein [Methylobacterium sp. NEAU 140]MDP4021111.1 hypothetical protein [Methylobacterium sp. NEAU 140]